MAYQPLDNHNSPTHATPTDDPFYTVKDRVRQYIGQISVGFERWKTLLETTNTTSSTEYMTLTSTLQSNCSFVGKDLTDLMQTVAIVRENKQSFPDIDDRELDSRIAFVNDMKALVSDVEEVMNSDRTRRKVASDAREHAARQKQSVALNDSGSSGKGKGKAKAGGSAAAAAAAADRKRQRGGDFVEGKHQEQQLLQRQQDDVLDDMHSALSRLGDITGTINTELHVHNDLLQEFDDELDDTASHMSMVQQKLEKLLGTSDKGRLCCLFLLVLIALVLFFLLVET